jgi:hypothetical protein
VISILAVGERGPLDGQVVGLRPAGGEDDLMWLSPDGLGCFLPRFIHGIVGLSPVCVEAGGVSIPPVEIGLHGFQYPGVDARGRAVVEIDPLREMPP